MAIDMTTVKQIMHNNKEVVKIEDGLGKVLWQKVADKPYIRLEYLVFDGTNYCESNEHNANNRAYGLDYMQTGWISSGLCYPFGIWTPDAPQNILLTRNERSNTRTGFEVCRVSNTAFGNHATDSYLNKRMSAEMRWGTDVTVYYRLRNKGSSSYIDNSYGSAYGRTDANNGNFFIGAINDGGGGTYSNANGMLIGNIYELAVADNNSFDYTYFYVPCQRKSDGAIGFKNTNGEFYPLRNKSDGSVVTNVAAHMGPVAEENWDGVTYTYVPVVTPYRRLEYIHFNGNDYIDSEYTPWNNFGFYLDIQWDNGAVGQYCGHDMITSNNRAFIGSDTGGKAAYGSGEAHSNISNSNTFERHTYQVNTSSSYSGKFYIDGTKVWSGNSYYVDSNRLTMFIGAINRGNTNYSYCKAKIYNVKFTNNVSTNSAWAWNLIPAQRKSDGAIGFLKFKDDGTTPDFMTSVNGLLEAGPVVEENLEAA